MKNFQIGDFVKVTFDGVYHSEGQSGKKVLYGEIDFLSKNSFGVDFFDKSDFALNFSNSTYDFDSFNDGIDITIEHIKIDSVILEKLGFEIISNNVELRAKFKFESSSLNCADILFVNYNADRGQGDYSSLSSDEPEDDYPHTITATIHTVAELQLLSKVIYKPSKLLNLETLKTYLISIQTLEKSEKRLLLDY